LWWLFALLVFFHIHIGEMAVHFPTWLQEVDPSGSLDAYLAVLEENCDEGTFCSQYIGVEEGKATLNPQFFDDMGIANLEHQLMFRKGVSGSMFAPLPRDGQATRPDEKELARLMKGTIHGTPEIIPAELSVEKDGKASEKTEHPMNFAQWLGKVDPTGQLDGYLPGLEEHFDVEDMDKLWSDGRFFEEIEIEVQQHRQLFADYFARCATK